MDVELWWVGKTNLKYLQTGIIEYQKRIRYFQRFEIREFPSSKAKKPEDQAIVDDQNLLRQMDPRDLVILLDEKGNPLSSRGFARYLDQLLCKPARKIVFVIGGPFGFGAALRQRADHLLSLSQMTFTHDLVRLIFLEQLYRALTIKNNLPYHH